MVDQVRTVNSIGGKITAILKVFFYFFAAVTFLSGTFNFAVRASVLGSSIDNYGGLLATIVSAMRFMILGKLCRELGELFRTGVLPYRKIIHTLYALIVVGFFHFLQSISIPEPFFDRARVLSDLNGRVDLFSRFSQFYYQHEGALHAITQFFVPSLNAATAFLLLLLLLHSRQGT